MKKYSYDSQKTNSMFKQKISNEIWGGENGKYRLIDSDGSIIDKTPEDTCSRVAKSLANHEVEADVWFNKFQNILGTKFSGGGRIMANVGAYKYKKETSAINCVVSRQIPDSMKGIMHVATEAALILKAGCGIGYDFSTLRPKHSYVFGAGSGTSGVISFMKIFDTICSTILSGGSRRGAQMGCLDIQHPDIEDFISAKRQDGMLRYFNVSVLITNRFMEAVEQNKSWDLWFWEKTNEKPDPNLIQIIKKNDIPFNHPQFDYFSFDNDHVECEFSNRTPLDLFKKKIFKTINAKNLFDMIMKSTYEFADPGFLLIDKINNENNLWFKEIIRACNPCGEQSLSPLSNCLLGSMLLCSYVKNEFEENAQFDHEQFKHDVRVAARLLDNVIEENNLPLKELSDNLNYQRRHGMGFCGLGSALNMLGMKYGSEDSLKFAENITLIMAQENLLESIEIAKEKGPAPFCLKKEDRINFINSSYNKRLLESFKNKDEVIANIISYGVRWSHATSIAPTGTMALSWGNNCSNGLEPVFANSYLRNIRSPNKKTKVQEEVCDYAFFLWKEKYGDKELPQWWSTTDNLHVDDHLNMQAVIQKWVDAAISKTINVPSTTDFEDFKNIYIKGWQLGLKGVTTFRFNPEAHTGVLVQKQDLEKTKYIFSLEDGSVIEVNGNDTIVYDGEEHNAANLYEALKEGIYGNM